MKVERLQVRGVDLEVVRGGDGPPVVLLHGPTVYSPEAPFLGDARPGGERAGPVSPGLRGIGAPGRLRLGVRPGPLLPGRSGHATHERVTLIGCSFGGWLAAELAVNYGHRLERLILVDPVGIKVGGREERDIVHLFNTSPAELARRAWHDPGKQRPGLLGLGWQQHLDAMSDEEMVAEGAGLGLPLSVRLASPPVQPQAEALAPPDRRPDAAALGSERPDRDAELRTGVQRADPWLAFRADPGGRPPSGAGAAGGVRGAGRPVPEGMTVRVVTRR